MKKTNLSNVSIVIPMRNEEKYVGECLESILENNYPLEKMEIFVVDGMSEDNSRKIVKQFASKYSQIKLLENPKKITPVARNIGVRNAKGKNIIVVDAHRFLGKDFIIKSIRCLQNMPEVSCVGGIAISIGENFWGNLIALALSFPFGVGNAKYRTGKFKGFVDIVACPTYRGEVFDKIGLFDEELIRNQDNEFNFRLTRAGGKIYLDPEIESYYYVRPSLSKLWRQHFQYSYWNVKIVQKYKRTTSWRHSAPLVFLISLIISGIIGVFTEWGLYLLMIIGGGYIGASLLSSLVIAAKNGWKYFPFLPLVFAIIHFGYGFGFLKGIWDFLINKKHLKQRIENVRLTR